MQAAFVPRTPAFFHENGTFRRKENAYVFDFDPARTLLIYEQFANDLSQDTASGKGDTEERKTHIQNLLNFFPVIGEDEEGEMIPLDAEKKSSASPEDQVQGSGADGFPEQLPVPEHFQRVQCAAGGAGHSAKLPAHQRGKSKAHPDHPGHRRRPFPERQGRGGLGRGLRHRQGSGCVRGENLREHPGAGHRPARPDRCPWFRRKRSIWNP